jgi:hypothetical protein
MCSSGQKRFFEKQNVSNFKVKYLSPERKRKKVIDRRRKLRSKSTLDQLATAAAAAQADEDAEDESSAF